MLCEDYMWTNGQVSTLKEGKRRRPSGQKRREKRGNIDARVKPEGEPQEARLATSRDSAKGRHHTETQDLTQAHDRGELAATQSQYTTLKEKKGGLHTFWKH
jgi:hypothetical protein